jgi:hypothetical protein
MTRAPQRDPAIGTGWIAPILELCDPIGVLSVYVDADPALASGPRPAWQAPVRAGLRRLVKEARRDWPRADRLALEARLDELHSELESLLDPRGSSRGRALFVGIQDGDRRQIELRTPLPPRVSFDRRAAVLPLFAAQHDARAAGVASVSWARLELSEWSPGELRELETIELAPEPEPGRGRHATNPSVPQPFPERDRFRTGVGARVVARTQEAGAALARHAEARGWDFVVADGDPRLLEALSAGFDAHTCEIVQSARGIVGASATEAVERVAATLHERRAAETAQLVARLDETQATRDPAVVARALAEGRVEHLLLAPPPEPSDAAAAESLARQALDTGAELTVVDPPTAALGPGGAAALLRW